MVVESGDFLLSRAVASQVPSAFGGLTSVFGMGTGGSLQLLSPETLRLRTRTFAWLALNCRGYLPSARHQLPLLPFHRHSVPPFALTPGFPSCRWLARFARLALSRPFAPSKPHRIDLEVSEQLAGSLASFGFSQLSSLLQPSNLVAVAALQLSRSRASASSSALRFSINSSRSSPRPISIGKLHVSPHFHRRPIYLIVSEGSYQLLVVAVFFFREASRLDAFSVYPLRTSLPCFAVGTTTVSPEVRPSRSSRTRDSSRHDSNAHNG